MIIFYFAKCSSEQSLNKKDIASRWSSMQGKMGWQDAMNKCKSIGMRLPKSGDFVVGEEKGEPGICVSTPLAASIVNIEIEFAPLFGTRRNLGCFIGLEGLVLVVPLFPPPLAPEKVVVDIPQNVDLSPTITLEI